MRARVFPTCHQSLYQNMKHTSSNPSSVCNWSWLALQDCHTHTHKHTRTHTHTHTHTYTLIHTHETHHIQSVRVQDSVLTSSIHHRARVAASPHTIQASTVSCTSMRMSQRQLQCAPYIESRFSRSRSYSGST